MPSPGTVTTPPQTVWPPFGAVSPAQEILQTPLGGKKRKVDSENGTAETRAESVTTIPGPLNVQGVVRKTSSTFIFAHSSMSDLLILQVRATGFIQYSDLRLKTNVQDLVDALRMVQDLQAKTYHWKSTPTAGPEEENGGKRVIGFIAQEVQRVVSFSSPFLSTVNTNASLSPPKK